MSRKTYASIEAAQDAELLAKLESNGQAESDEPTREEVELDFQIMEAGANG